MSRPTKFDDLSSYDQQGPTIAILDPALFLTLPRKTLVRLLKAIESLDKGVADGILDKEGDAGDGQEITYRLRPTKEDRTKKLEKAQREWDLCKDRYEKALVDPRSIPGWSRWSVETWAYQEGKPAIQWPGVDKIAEDNQ